MKKLYLIVFSVSISREDILDVLEKSNGMGIWFYSMANSVFVFSSLSAQEVFNEIKKAIPENERIFVSEVKQDNCQGRLPSSHWNIINWGGADKKYELLFHGYYRKPEFLSPGPGIYCVYRGVYNQVKDNVSLKELLYIGQSKDVKERHKNHENLSEWKQKLKSGEELQYTMAPLSVSELERCEAALIYKNRPSCNHSGCESFPYNPTRVDIRGPAAFLEGGLIE